MSVFEDLEGYVSPIADKNNANAGQVIPFNTNTLIEKIRENGFYMDEMLPILETQGSMLVVSGAGSGKTTVLIFKLQYDILSGELSKLIMLANNNTVKVTDNILVCTFNNSGAKLLSERLQYWQRHFGLNQTVEEVSFKTLHAEFISVLEYAGCKMSIIQDSDAMSILREVCTRYRVENTKTGRLSNEDYRDIATIVTYARNRLDNEKYSHNLMERFNMTSTILDCILNETKRLRRERGLVDFEDSQEILYGALLVNKDLQEYVASRYAAVYIDEFQDTSQIQYEILKFYFRKAKKVVAFGDDDQTIYSWRGSYIDIIVKLFAQDTNCTIRNLNINYRCPSNILNPVINSIGINVNRHAKKLQSYVEGGELNILRVQELLQINDTLIQSIDRDLSEGYSVAILARTNYDGLIPAMLAERVHKYNYGVTSEKMTASTALAKSILAYSALFTDRCSPRLKRVFESLLPRQFAYKAEDLYNVLRINSRYNIWTIPDDDLRFSVKELYPTITSLRHTKETKGEIDAFIELLCYAKALCYQSESTYDVSARTYINLLIRLTADKDFDTVQEFIYYVDSLDEGIRAKVIDKGRKKNSPKRFFKPTIEISTVHEAKGKEWDSVYIWDDSDGVFSNSKETSDIEEERRLHYIAWTRAKKKLSVITRVGKSGLFLKECGFSDTDITSDMALKLKGNK